MLQDILKEDVINDLRQELTEPIFNALNQVSNLKRPEYIGSKKNLLNIQTVTLHLLTEC